MTRRSDDILLTKGDKTAARVQFESTLRINPTMESMKKALAAM